MLGSVASAGPLGFLATSAAKALDLSNRKIGPKVTTVYALRNGLQRECQWQGIATFANLGDSMTEWIDRQSGRKEETEMMTHLQSSSCGGPSRSTPR